MEYGAYSLSLNNFFAEYHKYSFYAVFDNNGERTRQIMKERDKRWAKVHIMLDLLTTSQNETSHTNEDKRDKIEYFVWMDSDLVFLDMGMQLEQLVSQYKDYDMIFSADSQESCCTIFC